MTPTERAKRALRCIQGEAPFPEDLLRAIAAEIQEAVEAVETVETERGRAAPSAPPGSERLEARVQQAQKLESLGVLAGGIAHDFNNLLVGVLGYSGLALMELKPESTARDYIQRIEVAARRAADLTRQLLAYSGKGRFLVEPLDLNRLVREMMHLLQVSVSKSTALRCRFRDDLPAVRADATQLRQVVMNLLLNSSEALGDDGDAITISTGLLDADEEYLWTTYLNEDLPPGRYVTLEVSDTGCGMAPEEMERVFDPFFSTKLVGRGLGLAAVLGIVRGHRGAIKVYSEPGVGTTFKVLLPAEPAGVQPAGPEEVSPSEGAGLPPGLTVLVVDDEPAVREVARAVLTQAGCEVLVAADGAEAGRIFAARRDAIDLVLLDMTMPVRNGEETFRDLRRLKPDVKVILSSGFSESDATSGFSGKGLAGFLEKPYQASELLRKVREALAR